MPGIPTDHVQQIKTGIAVSSSANLVVACDVAQSIVVHVTATSSLAGVWEGTFDDVNDPLVTADWFDLMSVSINDAGYTKNLPAATVTPTDDDLMVAPNCGAKFVRFRRTAGSGTVSYGLSDMSVSDLLLFAGITATISGGATLAEQQTQTTHLATIAGDTTDIETELETGWTPGHLVFANSTNATVVKASAGRLGSVSISNLNDAPIYVKFYNKATTPDENDTPVLCFIVPANATAANGAGSNPDLPSSGVAFSTGISFRIVKGIANNSTTAVDASEGTLAYSYK